METGGMKGRRKEMIREELHEQLCAGFGVSAIHSEYGMTELLSLFFRMAYLMPSSNPGSRYRRCFDLYSRWKNRRNQRD
jgi:hypothetical protein